MESIEERVKAIVGRETLKDPSLIMRSDKFADDLDMDSLDMVQLTMELEDAFKLEISDKEVEGLKTVGDVIVFIEGKSK